MTDIDKHPHPLWNSRTELLLRKADLNDVFEAEESRQKKRGRRGFGLLVAGVVALVAGLTLDGSWVAYAVLALQVPVFFMGLHLLAGQEVRRLKKEVDAVEVELRALDSGEGDK